MAWSKSKKYPVHMCPVCKKTFWIRATCSGGFDYRNNIKVIHPTVWTVEKIAR